MAAKGENDPAPGESRTTVERISERELIVTRAFNAPARLVFKAWTEPEWLKLWWAPKSFGVSFISCEADARAGGAYRFTFAHPASKQRFEFFGRYIEATSPSRLVWTNDEGEDGAVTTVTFEERGGRTLVVMRDLYPSKDALDRAIASGSTGGFGETFAQLDGVLAASAARS